MKNLTVQVFRSTAAGLSLLALTSCSHSAPEERAITTATTIEPAQYQPPAQVRNATYLWSAEPGIDLLDDRGRLIRAAQESMIIAHYGGLDLTYPGFTDVLSHDYARRIENRPYQSLAGTMRAHILQIIETEAGFKATICSQPSHFAIRWSDGDYRITTFSGKENFVQFDQNSYASSRPRIELEPHWSLTEESAPLPPPPDAVPAENQWSAPTEDLFTDTGFTITFGADLGETMHRCQDWGRSIEPAVPDEGSETILSPIPPKTLPAYPGW